MRSQFLVDASAVSPVLAPLLAGAGVLLAAAAMSRRSDLPIARHVGESRKPLPRFSLMDALEWIGRSRPGDLIGISAALRRRMELARSFISDEGLRGLKLALACGSTACSLAFMPVAPLVLPLGAVFGASALRLPDLVLARRAARRQERIGAQVPDLVEILVATSEAGLSPPQAVRRASVLLRGPLGDELGVAVRHLDLGVPWRRALEQVANATDVPALRRLVAALARSHRLGAPVRSVLRSVADDLRLAQRTRAEEMARRAPVKMLFPMVFLILPAFLLLTVGPVVLATIRALH
jgi:pilus assembly protein TadC